MVFAGWGSWVARFRWPVLIVALVAVTASGVWGLGVFGQLTEGGYNDPNSESTHAAQVVTDTFGAQGGDLVVIYTPATGKIDDAQLGKRVKDSLAQLPKSAVTSTTSYWTAKSAQYAAKNKSSAVAVITLAGEDDAAKLDSYRAIDDKFAVDGATVRLSGAMALADASSARSTRDLGRAEAISLPITLILLVLIFGSLVAASLPVLVGGASVLGSLGILHAVSAGTDVNSFAVNVASLLGLGMAIDYGLFMVGRFREELAEGRSTSEAVSRTVGTAGRTVAFSATLLMIALAGLLLFPQGFLNSLAYGGLAAVFLAALLSLTLLPAMLAALGPRVDKLPVRLPRRAGAGEPGSGWAKLAGVVLRHPVVVAAPILLILLLFASPIRSVHFGENDERILPAGDPSRQAIETLKSDYPQFTGDSVQVVLRNAGDTAGFAVALRQVPGISQIGAARKDKGVTLFTATLKTKDAYSGEARDVVDAIRALPVPAGAQLLVGGTTARNVDSLEATAGKLPWMVAMLVGATLLLMFLAFGSVVLPIKAVLMSALSLCATFGLLVWIFQQGHGASLLDVTPAPLEVGIVVLMAAVVFGLSTDYEVFLLSRMVEARTRGASTNEAVTTGLARTGRVISAAALLLIVVTGAFALSAVTTMRFVGVGMIIALLLDATVVRMLLVPAVLRLIGDAAWWAPGPLRRLQQRAGLSEYAPVLDAPSDAPGRHAAPDDTQVIRYEPYGLPVDSYSLDSYSLDSYSLDSYSLYDERHALPAGAAPLALPVGSLSADDATQVFARFEDTAVINLAGSPPLEEVEAETVDDSPAPRPSADDDSIVDAEILDDDATDMPAFAEATSVQPWSLPAGSSDSPRTDWTVADEDGFFFGQPVEPSSYDTTWIPSPSEAAAEVAAMFADTHTSAGSSPDEYAPSGSSPDEYAPSVVDEPSEVASPVAADEASSWAAEPSPWAAEPSSSAAEPSPWAAEPSSSAAEPSSSAAEPSSSAAEPADTPSPWAESEDIASRWADAESSFAEPSFAEPSFAEPPFAEPSFAEPDFADSPELFESPDLVADAEIVDESAVVAEPELVVESPDAIAEAEIVDNTEVAEPIDDEPIVADEPLDAEVPDAEVLDAEVLADDPVVADEPLDAEVPADQPVAVLETTPVEDEPFFEPQPRAKAIYRPFVAEPVIDHEPILGTPEPFEPLATVDLRDMVGRRPTSLADQFPARRSPDTVGRPTDPGAYPQEEAPGLVENPTAETDGQDGQTSTRRPATLGDQPLPRRPVPSLPEPQPMTEPEPQPPAAAAPAAAAPADMTTPAPAPTPEPTPAWSATPDPATASLTAPEPTPVSSTAPKPPQAPSPAPEPARASSTAPEPTPAAPSMAPEVPAPYVVHEAPPLRAIPDVVTSRPAPKQPTQPTSPPAQPAPAAIPTPPESVPAAATPSPAPNPIPAAPQPTPTATPPNPRPPHQVANIAANTAIPAAARRPADLADHLRESRPSDLSDYTAGRIPRMRRPAEEKPKAPRRPATLADHLSSRKPADESTHDLRDHAAKE